MAERPRSGPRRGRETGSDLGVDVGTTESVETDVAVGESRGAESSVTETSTTDSGSYPHCGRCCSPSARSAAAWCSAGWYRSSRSLLVGILLGGFVYGLLASERRYAELGLAGGLMAVRRLFCLSSPSSPRIERDQTVRYRRRCRSRARACRALLRPRPSQRTHQRPVALSTAGSGQCRQPPFRLTALYSMVLPSDAGYRSPGQTMSMFSR